MENKGFTLIELVISIAILAVVGIGIASFVYVSLQQYERSHSEVDIQYEAQLTQNKIQDMVLDVTNGISVSASKDTVLYLYDYNADEDKKIRVKIAYHKEESKLRYTRYYLDPGNLSDGTASAWKEEGGTLSDGEFLSGYVSAFEVTLYNTNGDVITGADKGAVIGKVRIHLSYQLKQRKCDLEHTVMPRNSVIASDDPAELYP